MKVELNNLYTNVVCLRIDRAAAQHDSSSHDSSVDCQDDCRAESMELSG